MRYLSKIGKHEKKKRQAHGNWAFNAQLDRIDFMMVFYTNVFAPIWNFDDETRHN